MKDKKVNTIDIRPPWDGGIEKSKCLESEVKDGFERWRKLGQGDTYIRLYDPEQHAYNPIHVLPNTAEVTPWMIGEIFKHPYPKLAALKIGRWEQLKQWIPVAIVVIGFIVLVALAG